MADMGYDHIQTLLPRAGRNSYIVTDAETLFGGMYVGMLSGYLTKWADTAGIKPMGILLEGAVGDVSAPEGPVEGRINENGDIVEDVPIAGIAQANVGDPVYCGTSNIYEDATLTPTLNAPEIGIVDRFRSTGRGDIRLLTPTEGYAKA